MGMAKNTRKRGREQAGMSREGRRTMEKVLENTVRDSCTGQHENSKGCTGQHKNSNGCIGQHQKPNGCTGVMNRNCSKSKLRLTPPYSLWNLPEQLRHRSRPFQTHSRTPLPKTYVLHTHLRTSPAFISSS